MRAHPQHGERLIGRSPKFDTERVVARWHHERWDGTGYPDGLRGEAIPLAARIVAVADAFDALTTERPYKRAWTLDEAWNELDRRAEVHRAVVDASSLWPRAGESTKAGRGT
jgi:putative two-component system response regulator